MFVLFSLVYLKQLILECKLARPGHGLQFAKNQGYPGPCGPPLSRYAHVILSGGIKQCSWGKQKIKLTICIMIRLYIYRLLKSLIYL